MEEDLDFQIRFFEDLVEDDEDFVDAVIPLADAYTRKWWFEKGLRLDKKLALLKPDDACVFYNLGCSYALLNQEEKAVEALDKALNLGYRDLEWMEKDPDLAGLRKAAGYKDLVRRFFSEAGEDTPELNNS